ncbi:FERM and PDZ domain-containing protein 1 [Echeneis naucrates]|uniref:FERM and PDZ domain-containing protein 1 n=1 Tax=Echeneis naucrates TaxID=173247 RepID=UPI001113435B|nr:FERM and PDZ domain-containing protein 1-like [Echeneis naucrates]
MEGQDRSRSPSRRTSRVEQVVGRWLRRSRDLGSRSHSLSRDRCTVDGKTAESSSSDQRNYPFRFNVQIQRDPNINSHGLTLSSQTPIVVQEVIPGGPADGRLVPGDQLVKINNVAVDDLTPEQAAEIIRECQDMLTMTVLRTMLGPKSSFITPEKRAKLRSNPVKVHFAEEVEVNGHSQGNSLLFLPNVLKVYLENGQTKAFKFEPSTTVKDIVMTLKEKLSLSHIEHFSLVLEQRHSISKLLLLHDEERIQEVVQKKEAHDYRCLFRVCFMPKSLESLLQEDPTAFEYLYLQGVNDVLQERFAIEMRCNTALRLAALHIQERLASCGQSPKTNLKIITKTWGIENFVSSTLLRNMREKDLRKAIGYHMKKSQLQHDPKQKGLSVDQTRINYLQELAELRSFGGKSFSATMMLQDRESMVTLLVGAQYGVSQVVNHKLSVLSTLTEFTSITRIELLPESEKVSLVKIYLQDIKPITLLLESVAAKDMSCLIAGYCRVFVDPSLNIFPWIDESKKHRVSAEEGYVSRCGSDSNDSSDLDMEPLEEKEKSSEAMNEETEHKEETESAQEGVRIQIEVTNNTSREKHGIVGKDGKGGDGEMVQAAEEQPSASETSDSCHTDSRVLTSPSSDSLDALEEDDLLSCSSTSGYPQFLPSPPEASDDDDDDEEEEFHRRRKLFQEMDQTMRRTGEGGSMSGEGGFQEYPISLSPSSSSSNMEFVFNFDQSDARCYYNLCSNITPDSARSLPHLLHHSQGGEPDEMKEDDAKAGDLEPVPILQPPPGFGDSSSDEEFFDARDRFTSPEDPTSGAVPRGICKEMKLDFVSLNDIRIVVTDGEKAGEADRDKQEDEDEGGGRETLLQLRKRSRKRRSFMESDYTSMVSYPEPDPEKVKQNRIHKSLLANNAQMLISDPEPSGQTQNPSPTVSSLTHSEGEPAQLESKPILSRSHSHGAGSASAFGSLEQTNDTPPASRTKKQDMEMEPDAMEFKSVTDLVKAAPPTITVVRCRVDPDGKESADRRGDGKEEGEGQEERNEGRGEDEKDDRTDETENVAEGNCSNNVETTIQVTDVTEDVTQTTDFETGTNAETVDSDDSDTTVTGSEVDGELLVEITSEKSFNSPLEMKEANAPVQTEPKAQYQTPLLYSPVQNTPGPITEPPAAIVNSIQRDTSGLKIDTTSPVKDALNPTGDSPAYKLNSPSLSNLAPIVVTTQSLNRPGLPFHDQSQGVRCTSNDRPLIGLCRPSEQLSDSPKDLSSGCRVFTICEGPSQSTAPAEDGAPPPLKPEIGCSSVLASGCESVMEGVQVPLDACGCPAIYTNCFSSGDSFDEELTVYEFSCRTQSSMTQTSGAGLPVMTSPPAPSFLSTSSTLSPSFPRSILFSSSTSELSPLLSPLTDTSDCFLSQTHKDTISRLGQQRYPGPPTGFQVLRLDVDQLLSILEGSSSERAMGQGGRHPRDTCPAHFTENKRVLQIEARRLMSGCQKVVGIGQSPEEMLDSLADSFRTLVELAGICLWFSGCDRCDRRNAEAVAGLADVARSFRDFCLAAERTSSKRSCQDLSIKLLAKQCTALTASVFCLTQLFRTLTAL